MKTDWEWNRKLHATAPRWTRSLQHQIEAMADGLVYFDLDRGAPLLGTFTFTPEEARDMGKRLLKAPENDSIAINCAIDGAPFQWCIPGVVARKAGEMLIQRAGEIRSSESCSSEEEAEHTAIERRLREVVANI